MNDKKVNMEHPVGVVKSLNIGKCKILHVIDELSVGGAEKMLIIAANGFIERGYEIGVVTLIKPGVMAETLSSKITFFSLKRTSRFDLTSLLQLNKIARKYDLVHVHLKHTLKFVFLSWLLRPYKAKILLHDHSGDVLISHRNVYPFVMRWWIKGIYYLGVSKELTRWALTKYQIKPEQSFNLPNIISAEPFHLVSSKEKLNVDHIQLVMVSNFRAIKNLEFSIRLMHYLHERGIKVRLTIYGQPVEKASHESTLNLIETLKLKNVISLDSTKNNVVPFLKQFDMAIHCSFAETGPLCLLEYMSVGLPFLTINRGHVPQDIKGVFDEMVIDSFSLDDWADRLLTLYSRREQYPQELVDFFNQNYLADNYYNKLNFVYSKILE